MNENNNEQTNNIKTTNESVNTQEQSAMSNNVTPETPKKKGNTTLVITLIIIIVLLIAVIAILLYFKNNESNNSTSTNSNGTTTTEKIDFGNTGKNIIVYEYDGDGYDYAIAYSEDYKSSDGDKLTEYTCTGKCSFTKSYAFSEYENSILDENSKSVEIYIYDDGKLLKYDSSENNFNQIDATSKLITLSEYDTSILYFETDDDFGSFQLDTDNYTYDYNKTLLENGFIIVSTDNNYHYNYYIYDYKNNIIKYTIEDASSYNDIYENFIVISDLGIFTNDLTKISGDYDFCDYGGCLVSVTNDYVYIPDYTTGSIEAYDKTGNLSTITDYIAIIAIYDKYAFVVDSSSDLKVLDMNKNEVLADFNIVMSNTSHGQSWLMSDDQIWVSNEECRADSENTLWYYYDINTKEFGTTDYFNSTCS